jgi:hypothetical protein
MTEILLNDIERLNYRAAMKWLLSMHPRDLYDFLAETGADPWGKPNSSTRDGLLDYAIDHIDKNGAVVFLDWFELTGGSKFEVFLEFNQQLGGDQ